MRHSNAVRECAIGREANGATNTRYNPQFGRRPSQIADVIFATFPKTRKLLGAEQFITAFHDGQYGGALAFDSLTKDGKVDISMAAIEADLAGD